MREKENDKGERRKGRKKATGHAFNVSHVLVRKNNLEIDVPDVINDIDIGYITEEFMTTLRDN